MIDSLSVPTTHQIQPVQKARPISPLLRDSKQRFSGTRRSATLAFPKNDARLHSEFQVGIHEPADFPSEIDRAKKVLAACQTHADAPDDHGWIDEDTAALEAAIDLLDDGDTEHEAAKDKKKGFTKGRNIAASALHKMRPSVQPAARHSHQDNCPMAVIWDASWASINSAGVNLNADHVSNGVEYFLGGTTSPQANTTGFTSLPTVAKALDGTLSVTWTKATSYPGAYGTDYQLETSSTLAKPMGAGSLGSRRGRHGNHW